MAIVVYFTVSAFSNGAANVITLPYFKGTFQNGEYIFMLVWGMALVGRAVGGAFHYRKKLPSNRKFVIALAVYVAIALLEGSYFYFPIPIMMLMMFFTGLMGVTSYTIRISATQSYVPDEKKGRFNGAFNMLNTAGSFVGELTAGALTKLIPQRAVVSSYMGLLIVAALAIIGGKRKHVAPIYNTHQ
jgi:predicted MFS family arabinose efflux permease